MSPLSILLSLLALIAGFLFPFQAVINAQLGRGIGGPIAATMISFAVGLIVLVAVNFLAFRQIPALDDLTKQPLYLLLAGGALGAIYVSANVFLAPRIGAGALLCLVVAGQLIGALAIDRFGLFGLAIRELTLGRVAGVFLVFVGALLVRLT
ncbi:DMT family transporter [Methylocapsa sp. S129]|uniref:DMT family transporter n=1 Tax=Methylocapsa sp. S129 TaxID=1641869 RepID=UPI00131B7CA2|nr:DMT family transporter [Methylocapsa sp. S129]